MLTLESNTMNSSTNNESGSNNNLNNHNHNHNNSDNRQSNHDSTINNNVSHEKNDVINNVNRNDGNPLKEGVNSGVDSILRNPSDYNTECDNCNTHCNNNNSNNYDNNSAQCKSSNSSSRQQICSSATNSSNSYGNWTNGVCSGGGGGGRNSSSIYSPCTSPATAETTCLTRKRATGTQGKRNTKAAFTILTTTTAYDSGCDVLSGRKPNAIVYPFQRRSESRTNRADAESLAVRSSGGEREHSLAIHGTRISLGPSPAATLRSNASTANQNTDSNTHTTAIATATTTETAGTTGTGTATTTTTIGQCGFAHELKKKLSRLSRRTNQQHLNASWTSSQSAQSQQQNEFARNGVQHRPLFITTVPRGVFLPPPKEFILVSPHQRKERIYAYSSHPIVYRCPHLSPQRRYNKNQDTQTLWSVDSDTLQISMTDDEQPLKNEKDCIDKSTITTMSFINDPKKRSCKSSPSRNLMPGGNNASKGWSTMSVTQKRSVPKAFSESGSEQWPQFQQCQLPEHTTKRIIPEVPPYKNVMYDKRVLRGSNYGPQAISLTCDPFDRTNIQKRRNILRKIQEEVQKKQRNVIGTPPPVYGRRHEVVQTEKYLEELITSPVEFSVETQTDLFLERPPTPPYIPAKIGIDAATEIGEGELFHFEAEAQPIIDVLVDNTLELSLLEVAHEKEIAWIRKRQAELLAQREAELAELRRLESEEIRLQAEKQRRLRQDKLAKELDEGKQKDIVTAKIVQGSVTSILPQILDNLEPASDTMKIESLIRSLCPWLSANIAKEISQTISARDMIVAMIQDIVKQRACHYADYCIVSPVPTEPICEDEQEECCPCESLEIESSSDAHSPCPVIGATDA